ncbi:hypothetical protein ACP70R_020438 [Stipagrostis hirtigluma subsp. patula]
MADEGTERAMAAAIENSVTGQEELQLLRQEFDDERGRLDRLDRRIASVDRRIYEAYELTMLRLIPPPSVAVRRADDEAEAAYYPHGWIGGVPASAAAVASLEERTFRAGHGEDGGAAAEDDTAITGCVICAEDFEDGEELSVMPCSSAHRFHKSCIAQWLGRSNVCPLCRHALPRADRRR